MIKIDDIEKVVEVTYNFSIKIQTRFGKSRHYYKNVSPNIKKILDDSDSELDFLASIIDYIDIKTYDSSEFYITYVTSFNSNPGYEDHSLDTIIKYKNEVSTAEDKFEEIKEVIGEELAKKYNLRLQETTNKGHKVINIDEISDKEDIKKLISNLQ